MDEDDYQVQIKNIQENHYPKLARYCSIIALALNITPFIIWFLVLIDGVLIMIPVGFAAGAIAYGWLTFKLSSKKNEGKKALGLGILSLILFGLWYLILLYWIIKI